MGIDPLFVEIITALLRIKKAAALLMLRPFNVSE